MKILQVLPQEEYYSPAKGGAIATWVKDFSRQMTEYRTTVFAPYSRKRISKPSSFGAGVAMWQWLGRLIPGAVGHHIRYNVYVVWAAIYARIFGFDIIHVHNRPTYIPIIKRFNQHATVILHMHNDHVADLNAKQMRQLDLYSDIIISVSQYIENGIVEKGLSHGIDLKPRCNVLLNGSDASLFTRQKPAENSTILFVGRLNESKGIKQLVQAVLEARKENPEVKLLVAGSSGFGNKAETPFETKVKAIASQDEGAVEFLGYVKHDDVPALFADIAIYCIPSVWNDPCPLAVLEGMASGIPMIVGNRGGIPEQVADTALCIDCDDISLLSQSILYLLNNRTAGAQMAESAYQRFILNFTWDKVCDRFREIMKKNNLL